mgnify:CR=1 FL=1
MRMLFDVVGVFVQLPELGTVMEKHLLQHSGLVLHGRVLGQEAHLHVGIFRHAPSVRLRKARQDLQKRGLAGTVDADDAGLVPLVQIKVHIVQQLPAAEVDGEMFRG